MIAASALAVSPSSSSTSATASRLGRVALVTGASDGIGRATALALAEAGLDVIAVARRSDALAALASEISARGRACHVVVADLSSDDGVRAVVDVLAGYDVDAVGCAVFAAGFGTSGAFADADLASELAMGAVNCRTIVALTHVMARRLRARGGGAIALYGSLVAFQGVPGAAHYAATKAFVQTFAEGIGRELAKENVDVVSVSPGPVHSGFAARARMVLGHANTSEDVAVATVARLRRGGARTIRPGFLGAFLQASLATLPRAARVVVMEQIMAGMTRRPS